MNPDSERVVWIPLIVLLVAWVLAVIAFTAR
jgi:uncharacterized membrane protein